VPSLLMGVGVAAFGGWRLNFSTVSTLRSARHSVVSMAPNCTKGLRQTVCTPTSFLDALLSAAAALSFDEDAVSLARVGGSVPVDADAIANLCHHGVSVTCSSALCSTKCLLDSTAMRTSGVAEA